MAIINISGIRPYAHQKAVIDEITGEKAKGKIVVVNSSRQKGKSYLVSNILLYYALNYSNSKSFYVAPTLKQSKMLYKMIIDGIVESGIIRHRNGQDLDIEFINGSHIYFKSAEQKDALRGFTVTGVLCVDEGAFIQDDVFHLIQAWTNVKKAPILITSTPFVKSGFFWKYFNYGIERTHNCVTIDWSEEKYRKSIEELLPPEKLEEYREILPKNVFLTDYLGKFLDDEGSVFTNIKSCLKSAKIGQNDRLYVGIDWSNAGEGDYTVVSIFNQKGEQVLLEYWNKMSSLRQVQQVQRIIEPYLKQIAVIATETNSIGKPYSDLLAQQNKITAQKLREFSTTHTSKNAAVLNFQTALEKGTATLLPDEKQTREFSVFSATYNHKTRDVTYAAPQGLHDDCVMATLIAYDALRQGTATGNYSLTIRNNKVKHG